MLDLDRLQAVQNSLLDPVIDPGRWPALIEDLRIATGSKGVNLTAQVGNNPSLLCSELMGQKLDAYFIEGWDSRDYRVRGLPLLRRQAAFIDSDFMSPDDYNAEFFKFSRKYDYQFAAVVGFKAGPDLLCASFHRAPDQGPFTAADRTALIALSDLLTTASTIAKALSDARLDGLGAGFTAMQVPLMLFDRAGRLARLNQVAEKLLGPDISVQKGELRTRLPAEGVALRRLIYETWAGTAKPGAVARVTRQTGRPLIFRFQPLAGHARDFFTTAKVMGIITDLQGEPASQADTLRTIFGLSSAEAQVALLLGQGESVRSISELRGISYETARTHVKAILQKTEVRRQSELVSLFRNIR